MRKEIIVFLMAVVLMFSGLVVAQEVTDESLEEFVEEMATDETISEQMMDDAVMIEETEDEEIIAEAEAVVYNVSNLEEILADVVLFETSTGLVIEADFYGVQGAGNHGFHIHENGSCEDSGNAAGGHFNPAGVSHGFLPNDGADAAHVGDMGNVEVDEDGDGYLSVTLPGVTLSGDVNNVAGKAIIIHAQGDDFSQPTGNAGGRIGCGIIEVIE